MASFPSGDGGRNVLSAGRLETQDMLRPSLVYRSLRPSVFTVDSLYWDRGSDKFTRICPDSAGGPPPKKEEGGRGACLIQKPLEGGPPPLVEYGGASPHLIRAGKRVVPVRTPREPQVTALEPREVPLLLLRLEGVGSLLRKNGKGGWGVPVFFREGGPPLPHCSQKTVSAA